MAVDAKQASPSFQISYASLWRRAAAYVLDGFAMTVILAVGCGILFVLLASIGFVAFVEAAEPWVQFLVLIVFVIVALGAQWVYFPGMEASRLRATYGKLLCGICVTRLDGQRASRTATTVRWLGKVVLWGVLPGAMGDLASGLFFHTVEVSSLLGIIGATMLVAAATAVAPVCVLLLTRLTNRRQAPYDLLAGCVVVTDPVIRPRLRVATNVIAATCLLIGVVGVAQAIAYSVPRRWDMTTSAINSLGEGTENLLRRLDANVRITSLYFETDREEPDQARYRQAARDLIGLYETTNRSKVAAEWVNPLKDHEKFQKLIARLREKSAFKDTIAAYQARIDAYKNDLDGQMRKLVEDELSRIGPTVGTMSESPRQSPTAQVEELFRRLSSELENTRDQIDSVTTAANPQYSAAVGELKSLYPKISKVLKEVGKFGAGEVGRNPGMPAAQADFLREAGNRYAALVSSLEVETTKLQDMQPLKANELLSQMTPTSNAMLVETDADARVVDFSSTWPPVDQNAGGTKVPFEKRAFKGEEKLTAAILRATHKEQTAVVFVRYGGQPLFMGGFMPGQPPAGYAMMKQQLEDANFIVEEWDLKTKDTLPEIDPKPTRTLFVVLKPTPPQQRNPMMGQQQPPDPPFGESHRKALLNAMGEKGRALFIAGWSPGPFGPIAGTYEYNDYLKQTWGIGVDTSALLIGATNIAPGRYVVTRQDFSTMEDLDISDHDIVRGGAARQLGLPWCAPLELSATPPEGVKFERLISMPKRDGVWGVKNILTYKEQLEQNDFMSKVPGDLEGPFNLAVAATKGDAKIAVVSSRDFAEDAVAFARGFGFGSRGLTLRSLNPGNVTLLINTVHWLNDNTAFMNIGKPIDAAVLEIPKPSTVKTVQALTIVIWPFVALACGGVMWWVRRR